MAAEGLSLAGIRRLLILEAENARLRQLLDIERAKSRDAPGT
jgi:hypothetical protein